MTDRYSRQTVLASIGTAGQEVLLNSKVAVIGCGALGTHIASNLARAGIGHLRIMDRDIVELNNLQRQTLFDEADVGVPKVKAAAVKLRKINSEITIETMVKDLHNGNIEELIGGFHLVVDGTDNIPTRMILNDACVKHKIPWIYAGVIRTEGMVMSIMPEGPCLRCLLPEIPAAGSMTSCEIAGVLNTVPAIMAAIQCTEAMKILLDKTAETRKLVIYDVWEHRFHAVTVEKDQRCECCGKHNFTFLDNPDRDLVVGLCQDSVQIIPPKETRLDLEKIGRDLEKAVEVVVVNDYLLRFHAEGKQITVYGDGRALIKGTGDNGVARAVYARYLGL
jgi:adenylyltransferase/sulfurtransferase